MLFGEYRSISNPRYKHFVLVRCFLTFFVFLLIGDTIREAKACYRWVELYCSVLMDRIVILPACERFSMLIPFTVGYLDKQVERRNHVIFTLKKVIGEDVDGLSHVESVCRHGLALSGECGSPLLSMFSMLASMELAAIQGEELYAMNCWKEVYILLSVTYLQPLGSDTWDDRYLNNCGRVKLQLTFFFKIQSLWGKGVSSKWTVYPPF